MAWRLAKSLTVLRNQINAMSPNRSKASDGTIGDAAHSSRASDHNPDAGGVVRAMDITHDLAHGINSQSLADALVASQDKRIKYIISNGQIVSGVGQSQPAWKWRKYTGTNPHNKHVHISVRAGAIGDDGAPWILDFSVKPSAAAKPAVAAAPLLKRGSKGPSVETLQRLLNDKARAGLVVDGKFGAATERAVKAFQAAKKLVADGKVGAYTWAALSVK